MSFLSEYNITDYKAGGLKPMTISRRMLMATPNNFVAPRKLDFRDMCIPTSDQGSTPHCAGYSTAGFIEVQNWRTKHYPEQVNGDAIYATAKQIDGDNDDGTTLQSAVKAALQLKLYEGNPEYLDNLGGRDSVRFAMHTCLVCICGFIIDSNWNRIDRTGTIANAPNAVTLGGHAVLAVGYDPNYIYIQNSWSPSWGLYGFGQLSWEQFDKQFMCGAIIK